MEPSSGASKWSLCSEDSLLSIGSRGSVLSIGSIGSVLSVGSVGRFGVLDLFGHVARVDHVLRLPAKHHEERL
jgi:hypothetical protein